MPEPIKHVALSVKKGGIKIYDVISRKLNYYGIKHTSIDAISDDINAILVVGTDRDLLETLQKVREKVVPIIHISPPGHTAFFSSFEWEDIDYALNKIREGTYEIEDINRIKVVIDKKETYYALNEVAVFASRSAVLMEYTLLINNEVVWHDRSDGVIIATPIGSTAYAFSAGGPIVMKNAPVIVIVSVNSLNPMRRPIIAPDSAKIELRDLLSIVKIDVVVDGVIRRNVKKYVQVIKAKIPARFIRIETKLADIIERKTKIAYDLNSMPPSVKFIYKMLEIYGEASLKDLARLTGMSERTIRYALSILIKKGLVEKIVPLRDTRRRIYRLKRK